MPPAVHLEHSHLSTSRTTNLKTLDSHGDTAFKFKSRVDSAAQRSLPVCACGPGLLLAETSSCESRLFPGHPLSGIRAT